MKKVKIIGLPGTGKTTRLISIIEDMLNNHIILNLAETCICTFRKEMAFDIKEKLENKVDSDKNDFAHIGTIHGICKRLLNIPKNAVIEPKDIKEFMEGAGIEYSPYAPDIIDPTDAGRYKKGNILIDAYKWNYETKADNGDLSDYPNIHRVSGIDEIQSFIDEYNQYKQKKELSDFTDMLRGVIDNGYVPDTKVLMVDEFQDLPPIQNKIFSQWAANSDYVYIAGDPYQSIYPFWGATPEYFNNYNADIEILPISRRFGNSVWDFSKGILTDAGYDNIPQIEATGTSNEVKRIDAIEYLNAIPGFTSNTFHLVRCNYMTYPIAKTLIDAGVLFKGNYGWTDSQLNALNALIVFKNTGYLNRTGLIELINIHPDNHFNRPKNTLQGDINKALKIEYSAQDLKQITAPLSIHAADNFINSITKEPYLEYSELSELSKLKYRAVLDRLKEPQYKVTVNLGTIHSAKGREAQNVFIWNETNRRISVSCSNEEQLKDESRVWFVAATRTMNNLYWVESGKKTTWSA